MARPVVNRTSLSNPRCSLRMADTISWTVGACWRHGYGPGRWTRRWLRVLRAPGPGHRPWRWCAPSPSRRERSKRSYSMATSCSFAPERRRAYSPRAARTPRTTDRPSGTSAALRASAAVRLAISHLVGKPTKSRPRVSRPASPTWKHLHPPHPHGLDQHTERSEHNAPHDRHPRWATPTIRLWTLHQQYVLKNRKRSNGKAEGNPLPPLESLRLSPSPFAFRLSSSSPPD